MGVKRFRIMKVGLYLQVDNKVVRRDSILGKASNLPLYSMYKIVYYKEVNWIYQNYEIID
jgi:hypothetical protein